MQWPGGARDDASRTPQLRLSAGGHLELADAADAADDRFETVCDELGILLARRVEPVSARVLPFGREQLAMVQVRDGAGQVPTIVSAAAHGSSARAAIAEAAIDAMTQGNNVLAAALPSAVAEGKVRTAVVFAEGEAPLRWGAAEDEGRLAALFAVVPQLGTFTATAGQDTYRVLRLPGIGVSLVSVGPSAAAWVEGWFAALIHATQFTLRSQPATTVVAHAAEQPAARDEAAQVLAQVEEDTRRILAAAQDQARDLLAEARREAQAAANDRRSAAAELEAARAAARQRDEHDQLLEDRRAVLRHDTERDRLAEEHDRLRREAEREREALRAEERERSAVRDAERAREAILSEARRQAELERREAERACRELLAEVRREAEALRRDAEHERAALLDEARREAEALRRETTELREQAAKARRKAEDRERRQHARRAEDDRRPARDDALREARRAADDVLHEARRAAEDIVRDAARVRQQLADDARHLRALESSVLEPPPHAWVRPAVPGVPPHLDVRAASRETATPDEARAAELALLTAAAESVSAMASLLGRVAARREPAPEPEQADEPLRDVPGLFFGA